MHRQFTMKTDTIHVLKSSYQHFYKAFSQGNASASLAEAVRNISCGGTFGGTILRCIRYSGFFRSRISHMGKRTRKVIRDPSLIKIFLRFPGISLSVTLLYLTNKLSELCLKYANIKRARREPHMLSKIKRGHHWFKKW